MRGISALKNLALFVAPAFLALACFLVIPRELSVHFEKSNPITLKVISTALEGPLNENHFPDEIEVTAKDARDWLRVKYTLDPNLQAKAQKWLESHQPDYGALVAIDARTGRILSMVSYTKKASNLGNLALKAQFPAASVFKIVTAATAIDENVATPDTVFHFNGSNHTLYKRNVAMNGARQMTLKEAFAKSVNTVFAKLGVSLEPKNLKDYARRFGFNGNIESDVPFEMGRFELSEDDDSWEVAEVASGFTRVSVMSPLQGALMAAAIANDGVMMEPHLVDALEDERGSAYYHFEPKVASVAIKTSTAAELRSMMRETVTIGTSRKAFRPLVRRNRYSEFEFGGKTGSLTSLVPRGRCEWFVGYVLGAEERIAVAALTVHEKIWRLKASELARLYLEESLREEVQLTSRDKASSKRLR